MGLAKICCWKCCCCIPLHWAAMLIGTIQILSGLGAMTFFGMLNGLPWFQVSVINWYCTNILGFGNPDAFECMTKPHSLINNYTAWVGFSLGILAFIFGTILIYGTRMRVPMLLKSWIFSAALSVLIIIGLVIAWILEHPNAEMEKIVGAIYITTATLVYGYCSFMIYMRSKECWIRDAK